VASTSQAADDLGARYGADRVHGVACDVRRHTQVAALWEAASARFGRVDIWINNAALGADVQAFWENGPETLAAVVETNVLGTMYGAQVALRGMLAQGSGALYNLEGSGSDGRRQAGLAAYGTTKRAVRFLTDSLVDETKGTPVIVGSISPGMVVTDLLVGDRDYDAESWEQASRIFNILADRVETVTPWLADKVLANAKSGVRISWLTFPKVLWRFISAPIARRRVLDG
jgi:NAD(P)-dependent dehydrogenase (short-subunit alcohol dehydrogenase family)